MSKLKTIIVDKEIETNGIKHTVKYEEVIPRVCKTCKANNRRDGSAYCIECANKYKNDGE